MPELPEVCLYVNALDARITGQPIERVRLRSPSLLKTFDPPVSALVGKHVRAVGRIGKRIALHLDDDLRMQLISHRMSDLYRQHAYKPNLD